MIDAKNILVVDDEQDLCEILQFNLENDGYAVDVAYSAEQVLQKDLGGYSLILLDVMMGELSGFDLMKILRQERNVNIPTIFVTAKTQEDDLLKGFELGACDFVKKPFSPKEVVARVNAVIERTSIKEMKESKIQIITHDIESRRVFLEEKPIDFTKTEYDIFILLYSKPGKVYSRDEIIQHIWEEYHNVLGRTIDVNITRIRKKLGKYGNCVVTRSGYGYHFNDSIF